MCSGKPIQAASQPTIFMVALPPSLATQRSGARGQKNDGDALKPYLYWEDALSVALAPSLSFRRK